MELEYRIAKQKQESTNLGNPESVAEPTACSSQQGAALPHVGAQELAVGTFGEHECNRTDNCHMRFLVRE